MLCGKPFWRSLGKSDLPALAFRAALWVPWFLALSPCPECCLQVLTSVEDLSFGACSRATLTPAVMSPHSGVPALGEELLLLFFLESNEKAKLCIVVKKKQCIRRQVQGWGCPAWGFAGVTGRGLELADLPL